MANTAPPARHLAPAGTALIQHFEGCAHALGGGRFAAYPDPASGGDPWTIGWGSTGADIRPGVVWTQMQCDARFARTIQRFVAEVAAAIGAAATTQNQFDAMTAFHYNTGQLPGSSLLRLHVAGEFDQALAQFALWVHAAGRVLPGLVTRRAAEAALYGTPNQ